MKLALKDETVNKEALGILQDTLLEFGHFPEGQWGLRETGTPSGKGYDFASFYEFNDERWELYAVIKRELYPKQAWYEIMKLKETVAAGNARYAILIAPFISSRVAEMCAESGIGVLDLSGNCRIKFGGLWIDRSGRPRKYKVSRTPKSLFTVKASRIIRVLLKEPLKPYLVKELCQKAQVSLGQVSKVRKLLLDQDLAEETGSGILVKNRNDLIELWVKADDFNKRVEVKEYSLLASPEVLVEKLIALTHKNTERFPEALLFTMNFAASLRAAHNVVTSVAVYLPEFPDEQLLADLKAREVARGAGNLRVFIPNDYDALKIDSQIRNGTPLVSDLQIYLDLQEGEQNGKEQAEVLKQLKDFNIT